MDKDLNRRIRKAKRAQSRRSLSVSKGKKKCKIGKSCGATCIARHEICAVEMEEGISQDLGKTSEKVESRKKTNQPKEDALAVSFSNHIKENSFAIPGRSYSGEDIANMVNQAAAGMTGEARENMDKLRKFVVGDKQVLFVSTNGDDSPFKGKGASTWAWAQSIKYLEMLDKSIDFRVWGQALGIHAPAKSFSVAMVEIKKGFRGLYHYQRQRKLEELKLIKNIKMRQKRGWKTEDQEFVLEEIVKDRKSTAELISNRIRNFSNVIAVTVGAGAATSSGGRMILMADNKQRGDTPYSGSQKMDPTKLQLRVANVIDMRGKADKSTDISILDKDTYTFSGRGGERGNDRILMNYVHEVGHQIQFRGGVSNPPENSPSVTRQIAPGLTRYAHESKMETFAEAFVAYTFNPKALKEHDEPLYNWIKDTVEKALTNAGTNEGVW